MEFQKFIFILFFILMLTSLSNAAGPEVQNCDCSEQINPLLINISKLNENFEDYKNSSEYNFSILLNTTKYYENLSEYYKELYLNKEINVTNRELINIYNNYHILNQNITDLGTKIERLEKKTTIFSLEVAGISIGFSLLGITLIEFIINRLRKKKNGEKK